jgi:hypothetical protein
MRSRPVRPRPTRVPRVLPTVRLMHLSRQRRRHRRNPTTAQAEAEALRRPRARLDGRQAREDELRRVLSPVRIRSRSGTRDGCGSRCAVNSEAWRYSRRLLRYRCRSYRSMRSSSSMVHIRALFIRRIDIPHVPSSGRILRRHRTGVGITLPFSPAFPPSPPVTFRQRLLELPPILFRVVVRTDLV